MKTLFQKLGPGILYAGAAIGVSHLVQSTRAGANYGFYFLGIIILANALKYPFFEISPIYTSKTGENLMKGYKSIHPIVLRLFLLVNLSTFIIVLSAITLVTSGLSALLFPIKLPLFFWVVLMSSMAFLIIYFGHYHLLKVLTKYVVLALSVFTLIALAIALFNTDDFSIYLGPTFDWKSSLDIAFLLALVGWMPAPLELSAWHSSWTLAEKKSTDYNTSLLDFKIGYWGTMILAIAFMTLGALVMFGNNSSFPDGAVAFSGQLIDLFTSQFGAWSFTIIAFAAFGTMFTTLLTCFDAYPRVISEGHQILTDNKYIKYHSKIETSILLIASLGVMTLLYFYLNNIKSIVDFATTVSFIAANLIALFNFIIAVKLKRAGLYPKGWFRWFLMIFGLIGLFIFSVFYLMK